MQEEKKKNIFPMETLVSKQKMAMIGLGTYKVRETSMLTELLRKGLQCGSGRHIDTARYYDNEIQLGQAIRTVINEGRTRREDLIIATKIFNHRQSEPILQVKEALRLMGLKYFDLLYLHWPLVSSLPQGRTNHRPLHQIWRLLEQCVSKGYARNLGISNFNAQLIHELLAVAEVRPSVLQIEVHPYLQNTALVDVAQKNKIIVVAHTPLARADSLNRDEVNLLKDQTILDLAFKYSKTPAQIVLKSLLQRGIGVIPKTASLARLAENSESWNFQFTQEDLKKLRALNRGYRICDGKNMFPDYCLFD